MALSTSASYDAAMGLPVTTTGMNGETTTVDQYDTLSQLLHVSYPDGGTLRMTHTPWQTEVARLHDSDPSTGFDGDTLKDGYGRLIRTISYHTDGSTPWNEVDNCYDATGLVQFQPVVYLSSAWPSSQPRCSGSGTSYTYDALGRVLTTTTDDGTATTQYFSRAVKTTDVNNVQKITQYDIMGRLTGVCEISSNGNMPGSGAPVNCGMDIAGTGFLTTYNYALSTHTTTVTQGAQTRTTITDAAGRTVSTTEPERGTTTYSYAYNGTGLVVTRTRPQANQTNPNTTTTTTTQYDSIGRPTSINYSDGTPTRTYTYDQAVAWGGGASLGYSKGRLTRHQVSVGNGMGQALGYDAMGRVVHLETCRASTCGQSSDLSLYTCDWVGNMTSASNPLGTTTYNRSHDGMVTSITSSYANGSNPGTLVSNVNNSSTGPLTFNYGNGLSQDFVYDSMGRLQGGWVCRQAPSFACGNTSQDYGFYKLQKGAQVPAAWDNITGQNTNYGYDEFNRLSSANYGNGAQTFTYTYDRYGNRWSQNAPQGGPAPSFSFNAANNQIVGMQYDAAGNLLSDGVHSYTYDAEGNQIGMDNGSAQYLYDALNHRVWEHTAGNAAAEQTPYQEIDYDVNGQRASIWDGQSRNLLQVQVYWDGAPLAFYKDGAIHFQHKDWEGSERIRTGATGAVERVAGNFPFGESSAASGTDIDTSHFALLDHDSESGNEDATFRKLSSRQGRWMSPDPYDGSYDAGDPQSMNRYTYALNNPLYYIDPDGTSTSQVICENGNCVVHVTVSGNPPPPPGCDFNCRSQAPPSGPSGGGQNGPSGPGQGSNTQPTSTPIPAPNNQPTVSHCLGVAGSNGRAIALGADLVGDIATGVAIANPASTAAILIGAAATSVGTLNVIAQNGGFSDVGIATGNQTVAAAGVLTHGLEVGSFIRAGTSFAKGLTHAGVFGSVVSTVTDASAAISAYTSCRSGT